MSSLFSHEIFALKILLKYLALGGMDSEPVLSYIHVIKAVSTISTFTSVKGLEQVSIPNLIESIDLNKLHEIREFLERCLDCKSNLDLSDFYSKLAHAKGLTLSQVNDQLAQLREAVAALSILDSQIETQLKQWSVCVKKDELYSSLHDGKHSAYLSLCVYTASNILSQMDESYLYHADLIQNYWDYFPQNIQEAVASYVKSDVDRILTALEDSDINVPLIDSLLSSLLKLKNVLEESVKASKTMPKFSIPDLTNLNEVDYPAESISSETLPIELNRKYTLEELVSKVTLENGYEETDWGDPVGEEVW